MSEATPSLSPPRGMRDVYPEDMVVRDALFTAWRQSAERFGFQHYDACVVESLDLLKRKAGEEITDQIYHFEDKSGRELALRPEMTPTLARMVAARQGSLELPLKWYTIAQCFRYERMTRGRKREHYQWNLDIIGEPNVTAELETIATAVDTLAALGLRPADYRVRVSSRALLSDLLQAVGVTAEHHAATFLALDKRGKQPDEAISKLLTAEGLATDAIDAVFRILAVESFGDAAELLPEPTPALQQLHAFLTGVEAYGITDAVVFDVSVIRGLAYYTGIVFEAFDTAGEFRAIFGGGRYDNLLAAVGGKPQTGVGLGFGDVVVSELLEARGLLSPRDRRHRITVGYMQADLRDHAITLATALRLEGMRVDLALHPEKPGKFFARADKRNFAQAAYIGPDDLQSGTVRLKDMRSGEEQTRSLTNTA